MRVKWELVLLVMFSIISVSPASAMTVKDMAGRTFDLKTEPQRIICVGPGALRLITYLKALDWVVGIESMEKQFPHGPAVLDCQSSIENPAHYRPGRGRGNQ